MAEAILKYVPTVQKRSWVHVADFTRSAIRDFAPTTVREALDLMRDVGRYAIWMTETAGHELDRDTLFDVRFVQDYFRRGCSELKPSTASARRANLRRIAVELNLDFPLKSPKPRRGAKQPSRPYTDHEIAHFISVATTRTSERRRHNWMVLLALAAGCGLRVGEIMQVRRNDVSAGDVGMAVTVRGMRPRTVTCLADWAANLEALCDAQPSEDDYLYRVLNRPKSPGTEVGVLITLSTSHPRDRMTADRLRSTWIVGHLSSGVPAWIIAEALGVTSLVALDKYLRFIPRMDPTHVAELLTGADSHE